MRALAGVALVAAACSSQPKMAVPAPPTTSIDPAPAVAKAEPAPEPSVAAPAVEKVDADTPKTTVAGSRFILPAGWSMTVRGPATILTPPEGGSSIALVDVKAKDSDHAVGLAWQAYDAGKKYAVKVTTEEADHDGWSEIHNYEYQVSPNEQRAIGASSMYANGGWLVVLIDMAQGVAAKRGSQLGVVFGKLFPSGYERESFAGKKANALDAARIAELGKFIETSEKLLGVPGVGLGIIQDGKIVYAGGYGVRRLGKAAKVDADTKFMIASNTKAMTTLMLAKLVDEKKLTWETTATSLLPQFKLGDADTTSKVLVKHLICACTGMPRQDMEWLLEFKNLTPEGALATLGTMQPTSKFGELFQYSNPLAAAAGFLGGHVAFPKLELGKAYDEAMRTRVFGPLGMTSTTFDYKKAEAGDAASPHSPDVDGKPALAMHAINYSIIALRPAGAAWSTVHDMLKYVQMELDEGKLPSGKQYVSKEALLARRAPQVAVGEAHTYGMGLMVDTRYGVTVVHHGGDLIGFHSDMIWLPEYNVGAVILTNGDPGWIIRNSFRRKLLETLFDGKPEADAEVSAAAKTWFDSLAAERKLMTVPADAAEAATLAATYANGSLGEIKISKAGQATVFDFGEWKSEVASRKNPDGSTSFLTTAPGISGLELVVGAASGKRTLTLRDPQHEYVFVEK